MEGAAGGTKVALEYVDDALFDDDGDVAAAIEQATTASTTILVVKFISLVKSLLILRSHVRMPVPLPAMK